MSVPDDMLTSKSSFLHGNLDKYRDKNVHLRKKRLVYTEPLFFVLWIR